MTLEVFRHKLADLMEARKRQRANRNDPQEMDPVQERFILSLLSLSSAGRMPPAHDLDWLDALWSEYCTKRPRVKRTN